MSQDTAINAPSAISRNGNRTTQQTWQMRPWTMAGRSGRTSFWVDQALGEEPGAETEAEVLEGELKVDVCIVGGGFTGLWTAIRLLDHDPSLEVAVVEAELCGTGASGRNGGVMSDWWMEVDTLRKHFGEDGAKLLAHAVGGAADEIQAFCEAEEIEANVARDGWYWTATTDAQIGSPIHRMGLRDRKGGSLHPARLARGLRRAAIKRGARVFERSPVTEVRADASVSIKTERGRVSAAQIVMAANAWMAHLADFRRDTFICSSDLVATAPAPERFEELGWTGEEVSFDAKAMLFYWRSTTDHRVVFGNVGRKLGLGPTIEDRWESPSEDLYREIEMGRRRVLPRLGNVDLTHAWAGPIDRSSTGLPRIGKLGGDPRITYVMGFSGTGVLPTVTLGHCLASVVLDRDDGAWAQAQLLTRSGSPFPPEPIRYLGGRLVQKAIIKKESAEDLGRKPPRFLTALTETFLPDGTHLAPPTLSSIRKAIQR